MTYAPGPMIESDWARVKWLTGNFGDKSMLDRRVVLTLDDVGAELKMQVLVTCGTTGKHVEDSFHYKGLALDFMLARLARGQLPDVLLTLFRFGFTGIGMYSEWRLAAPLKSIGGFHVDFRPTDRRAIWLKTGAGYIQMSWANIKENFT